MELTTVDDKISALLERIAIALESQYQPKPSLGFHDAQGLGSKRFIFIKNNGGLPWYYLKEGSEEQHWISEKCLTGRVVEVAIKNNEKVNTRTGEIKVDRKLLVTVESDLKYVLWVGLQTHFATRVLLSLSKLNDAELSRPVTLIAEPFTTGNGEAIVLCDLYRDGAKIELSEEERNGANHVGLVSRLQERFNALGYTQSQTPAEEPHQNQVGGTRTVAQNLRISATLPPSPPVQPSPPPIDASMVLHEIGEEMKKLNWGAEQGKVFLKEHYGKQSRSQLTDAELVDFRDRLHAIAYQQLEPAF